MAVDAYGWRIDFDSTGGEVNDCKAAPEVIAKLPNTEIMIADRGYDSKQKREQISAKGSQGLTPSISNAIKDNADLNKGLYKYRHLAEKTFARLKHDRAWGARFDKLKATIEVSLPWPALS